MTSEQQPATNDSSITFVARQLPNSHHSTILQLQYQHLMLRQFCCQLPTTGNGLWKNNAGRVDCLKNSAAVDASCHLAYQHRRHALWTQLLVNAQEVNFNHPLLTTHTHTSVFVYKCLHRVPRHTLLMNLASRCISRLDVTYVLHLQRCWSFVICRRWPSM